MRLLEYLNEVIDIESSFKLIERECKPFLRDLRKLKISSGNTPKLLLSGRNSGDSFIERKVRKDRKPKDTDYIIHEWADDYFYIKFGIRSRSQTLFCTSNYTTAKRYGMVFIICPIGKYEIIWSPKVNDLYTELDDEGVGLWYEMERDPDTFDNSEIEEIYYKNFGEGSGKGHFEWKGKKYPQLSRIEVIGAVVKEFDEDNLDVYNNIIWVPELSYEEFEFKYFEELRKEAENKITNLMKTYKKGDLKGAIESENEVMLYCDRYYGVNFDRHSNEFVRRFGIGV